MAYKYDEKQAKGAFEPLPIAEYEAIISNVEPKVAKSNAKYLNLTLTIRNDVEQGGQNRKMFAMVMLEGKAVFQLHQLLKNVGTDEGAEFENEESLIRHILYKPIRFKNKHEEYEGKTNDRLAYWMPTQHPTNAGQSMADTSDPFSTLIEINESDLPF